MVINYSIVTDNQIIEAINNPEYKKNVVSIAKRLQVPYRRVMRLAEEVNIEGIVYQPIKRNYVSREGMGYRVNRKNNPKLDELI